MRDTLKDAIYLAMFLAVSWLVGYLVVSPALSHDFYDIECCSDKDCTPIAHTAVSATPEGWYIAETGETVRYKEDKRLKQSPDGNFHWCARPPGYMRSLRTICLYVPPMGY